MRYFIEYLRSKTYFSMGLPSYSSKECGMLGELEKNCKSDKIFNVFQYFLEYKTYFFIGIGSLISNVGYWKNTRKTVNLTEFVAIRNYFL